MLKMGSVNINATSKIGDMDAAYFNASFSESPNANYSITKSVANMTLYTENQDQCDSDYMEFEEKAKEITNQIRNKTISGF